jgi:hypothetical protein
MCNLTVDPNAMASIWSAVAATFSAIAALLAWRAQIHAMRESLKPELAIQGWRRERDSITGIDSIFFTQITNNGKAAARQVSVNASAMADDHRPKYVMSTLNVPSLIAGETVSVEGKISIHWNHAPVSGTQSKILPLTIEIYYWDSLNVRHVSRFVLHASENLSSSLILNPISSGVGLISITTESVSVRKLKIKGQLARIPLLGRAFREVV